MAIISRPRIENLRNIFLLVFFILVVTIIFTPLLIQRGFSFFSEELFEAVLLFVQVSLAWKIFRLYEKTVKIQERDIQKLETEYQKREKELLETFAYLGKINVQMSLIKSFLQRIKAPENRKEMKEYIEEILRMAMAISRKDWIAVRIINTRNFQTVSEYWVKTSPKINTEDFKIGNRDIAEMEANRKLCGEKGYCVLSSSNAGSNGHKTFLVFLEDKKIDQEILDFLKAAVNQCEVIHNLFELRSGRK
jgi:hypothetical protein